MSSESSTYQRERRSDCADVLPSGASKAGQSSDGSASAEHKVSRIAELEAENAVLRAQLRQERLMRDSAIDYAIITMDIAGLITSWSLGAERVLGYAECEILGRSGEIVFTPDDRAGGRFTTELCRAIEHGRAINERWHLRRDGTRLWASGIMMPLLDASGRPEGFLNILLDRTEARAAVESSELLMEEMKHRIKNTFSTVQAVATQTGRNAQSTADFLAIFGSRLKALSQSHDLLVRAGWEDAPLRDVIEKALAAYDEDTSRINFDGISVMLAANLVVTVSLAVHELATNAAKYGALSVSGGCVDIVWTVDTASKGPRCISISWSERGGPLVQQPKRRGFGSHLLEKGMSGSTVKLDFNPAGLKCHISLPLGTRNKRLAGSIGGP